MAKNVLKAWLVDNTVTTDDKTDKIFSLETVSTRKSYWTAWWQRIPACGARRWHWASN